MSIRSIMIIAGCCLLAHVAVGQSFQKFEPVFSPALDMHSKTEWVDLDNDDDLDLLSIYFSEYSASSSYVKIFINDNNTFAEKASPFGAGIKINPNAYAFGDYNQDGYLDILFADSKKLRIAKNDQNGTFSFIEVGYSLGSSSQTYIYWLDADADGDLDIFYPHALQQYNMLLNSSGTYNINLHQLPRATYSYLWADVNNDGLIDYVGSKSEQTSWAVFLHLNRGEGVFEPVGNQLSPGITDYSQNFWQDLDGDGDIDLFVNESDGKAVILKNMFVETGTARLKRAYQFKDVATLQVKPGDLNNDALPDFVINSTAYPNRKTSLYTNQSTKDSLNFLISDLNIPTYANYNLNIVDIDKDKDLDIFISAQVDYNGGKFSGFYKNNNATPGDVPEVPVGLKTENSKSVILSWTSMDDAGAMRYLIEINRNGVPYLSALSTASGSLLFPEGPIFNHAERAEFRDLPYGTFTWRVQAISAAGIASAFSLSSTFTVELPPTMLLTKESLTQVRLDWQNISPQATAVAVFRRSKNEPAKEIAVVQGPTSSYTDIGLALNTRYLYFVRSVSSGAYGSSSTAVPYYAEQFNKTTIPSSSRIIAGEALGADVDNDNDYDIVVTGDIDGQEKVFYLKNDGSGSFGNPTPMSDKINFDSWGLFVRDIDNDGDEDFGAVYTESGRYALAIYSNTNGAYTQVFTSPLYSLLGKIVLRDFNNDGLVDIFYTHQLQNTSFTYDFKLFYQKENFQFEYSRYRFIDDEGDRYAQGISVADFDNDGYLDIFLPKTEDNKENKIFRNLSGQSFSPIATPIYNAQGLVDYNQDGYIDIIRTAGSGIHVHLGNGNFTFKAPFEVALPISFNSGFQLEFSDVDLNGFPDIVMCSTYSMTMMNNFGNGKFATTEYSFDRAGDHMVVVVADIENDGDLDILAMANDQWTPTNKLYTNQIISPTNTYTNEAPSKPGNIKFAYDSGRLKVSWDKSTDDKTPSEYLSYNLQVRNAAGKIFMQAETSFDGNFHRLPAQGNTGNRTFHNLNALSAGQYFVKVQALDAAYKASPFTSESSYTILEGPSSLAVERILLNKVKLHWNESLPNESKIIVERKDLETDYTVLAELAPNATEFIDNLPAYNKLYTYRVYGIVNGVPTPPSNNGEWNTRIFVPTATNFANLYNGADVGDYTGDGRMDLLFSGGRIYGGTGVASVFAAYENTATGWTKHEITPGGIPNYVPAKFYDLNGDHLLDVYKFGFNLTANQNKTEVFGNKNNATFSPASNLFTAETLEILIGIDKDLDNDLDYFVQKDLQGPSPIDAVLNIAPGSYVKDHNLGFGSPFYVTTAVADFDNDGDEDVVGFDMNAHGYKLFSNVRGSFVATEVVLYTGGNGYLGTMDFDGDGWIDVYYASIEHPDYQYSRMWKNQGLDEKGAMRFTLMNIDVPSGSNSLHWADYDHDGDLDMFAGVGDCIVLNNIGNGQFEPYRIPDFKGGLTKWIDYDNDGDLDVFVSSYNSLTGSDDPYAYVLLNQMIVDGKGIMNEAPDPPDVLTNYQDEEGLHLNWSPAQDDHTPASALTYDVIIYRDNQIWSKGALNPVTGKRYLLTPGRSQKSLTLNDLNIGRYTWQVQSIDQSFAGSSLSSEGEFFFRPVPPIMNDTIIYRCDRTIMLTAQGQNIEWFSDQGLTSKLADGTFSPNQSRTVYVTQTIDGVRGIPNKVAIQIHEQPDAPTIIRNNPALVCEDATNSPVFFQYFRAQSNVVFRLRSNCSYRKSILDFSTRQRK